MIIPAIFTILFIVTVHLVGGYFIYKDERKWEDALMKYIEEMVKEAKANEADSKTDGTVAADAKPLKEVV